MSSALPISINNNPLEQTVIRPDIPVSPVALTGNKIHVFAMMLLIGTLIILPLGALGGLVGGIVAACVSSVMILAWGAAAGGAVGLVGFTAFTIFFFLRQYKREVAPPEWDLQHGEMPKPVGEVSVVKRAMMLPSSEETTKMKIEHVRHAKSSVKISGNFCGGKPFIEMLQAIREAHSKNPNLRVEIISSEEVLGASDRKAVKELQKEFADSGSGSLEFLVTNFKLRVYQTPGKCPGLQTTENHVKRVIVDEKFVFTGGTNLQENLCRTTPELPKDPTCAQKFKNAFWTGGACDMDNLFEGEELAKSASWEFQKLKHKWGHQMGINVGPYLPVVEKGEGPNWKELVEEERIVDDPNELSTTLLSSGLNQRNLVSEELIKHIIDPKTKSMYIQNMSFYLSEPFQKAFQTATHRMSCPPEVEVITNGIHSKCPRSVHFFGKIIDVFALELLQSAGRCFNIHIYQKPNVMFHRKIWVFQKNNGESYVFSLNGNLSFKSEYADDETGVVIKSKKLAKQVLVQMKKDLADCKELTIDDALKTNNSLMGRIQASILAPLSV